MGNTQGEHWGMKRDKLNQEVFPTVPDLATQSPGPVDTCLTVAESNSNRASFNAGYEEVGVSIEFSDMGDDEDDHSSNNMNSSQDHIIDDEGLTEAFNQWFKRRRLFQNPFRDTTFKTLKELVPDTAEVRSIVPKSNATSGSGKSAQDQDTGLHYNYFMQQDHRHPKNHDKEVIKLHHEDWSKKRSLPEGYRKDEAMSEPMARMFITNHGDTMGQHGNKQDNTKCDQDKQPGHQSVKQGHMDSNQGTATGSGDAKVPIVRRDHHLPSRPVHTSYYPDLSKAHREPRSFPRSSLKISTGFDEPPNTIAATNVHDKVQKRSRARGKGVTFKSEPVFKSNWELRRDKHWEPFPDYDMGETDVDDISSSPNPIRKVKTEECVGPDQKSGMSLRNPVQHQKVQLSSEFDPKNFIDQAPNEDASGKPIPQWKRLLLARQIAEKAQKDSEENAKKEKEEARFRDMPVWKRALIEKRIAETKPPISDTNETNGISTNKSDGDEPSVPHWQKLRLRSATKAS